MADELYFCVTCKRTMDESNFYSSYDLEKYPSGKLDECKKCCTMGIDNFDPETYKPLLEKIDIPYVPEVWMDLLQKYAKNKKAMTGMTVLGRYISVMRLKQWRDFRYKDSEYLQQMQTEKAKAALKSSGYDAATIDQYLAEREKALTTAPERPPLPEQQSLTGIAAQVNSAVDDIPHELPSLAPSYFEDNLTEEEKKYLCIKWGRTYTPEQWIKLEKQYNEMCESYDIQSAGHIDTLKLLCKTSLKCNELVDINDIEGYQKMSKVYDQLMKSGKFQASQNKNDSNNFVDSVSELVAICEEQGFIPRYYTEDVVNDAVDLVLKDTKTYVKNLVTEELNLGDLIENALKTMQAEENKKEDVDDIDDLDEEESYEPSMEDLDEFEKLKAGDDSDVSS